jgi:predicted transcriptional regulator
MITGRYIRELRENLGITQTELARLVNVSQAHIAKIENETVDPRLSTINRILEVLNKLKHKTLCKDIMNRRIIYVRPNDSIMKAMKLMKMFAISQLPVFERKTHVGSITESTILKHMDKNLKRLKIKDIMNGTFPIVDALDTIEILPDLLKFHQAVLVCENGKVVGVITKSDLLDIQSVKILKNREKNY